MNFKDYGIVDWFDASKGFGVAKTTRYGKVFIHKNNIDNIPDNGDYVLIGEIRKNTERNRYDGIRIIKWDKSLDDFCEEIFKSWQLVQPLKFNTDIKWLLSYCSVTLLEKIIDSNRKQWYEEEEFLLQLEICSRENKSYKNKPFVDTINEFFFEVWLNTGAKKYDKNLKRVIGWGVNTTLIMKALLVDYNWIKDRDFISLFNNQYFHKGFIYSFLIKKVFEKDVNVYTDDIKWIVTNGNSSIFTHILEFQPLYSNDQFIFDLRESKDRYGSENYSLFLYDFWIFKNDLRFNDDVKCILHNGSASLISRIIDINLNYWCHDDEFIAATRELRSQMGRKHESSYFIKNTSGVIVSNEKISVIETFIFNIWNAQEIKEFDENLKWIIANGNIETLISIINQDKNKWYSNHNFVDYIREISFYNDNDFKVNFLFDVCLSTIEFKYTVNIKWLFENASLAKITDLLVKKADYHIEILEKIYKAFFPNNDVNYYLKKATTSEWSVGFKSNYIQEKKDKIDSDFTKLLLTEIEATEKNLIKKKSIKKETHAATDLANFVFCPVSYALNQTFYIDIQEQENVFIGTQEHEKQRLLSLSDNKKIEDHKHEIAFHNYYQDFNRIINATCISQGHKDKNSVVYYSKKKKLSGVPDYIFQDSNGCFAVEEKYTLKKYEELTELYLNHKIQALVYLYGLDEFQFNEVFVLYWFIKKDDYNDYHVYNYRLFRLTKTNENKKMIIDVFNTLESIQQRIPYLFTPNNINYRKCIRCNYFPYCEHKKGNNSNIVLSAVNAELNND